MTTVLFVDDEPHVLAALKQALRKSELVIETATSGEEALERLAHAPVDVVVSDERMPGTQGSELLTVVRAADPSTIRILLTGQASVEAAIRAVNEAGVHRFLTKPCPPQVLLAAIRELVAARNADRQARRAAAGPTVSGELEALEREHPGIATVHRTGSGAVVIPGVLPGE